MDDTENNGVMSEDLERLLRQYAVVMSHTFDLDTYLFSPEQSVEYNAARLVCLLAQSPRKRIAGKRKLVLLDYLVRHPRALFRILSDAVARGTCEPSVLKDCRFEDYELGRGGPKSEPRMIHYPLGPYDPLIDTHLSFLMVRGLVTIEQEDVSNLSPRQLFVITKEGLKTLRQLEQSHRHILGRAAAAHKLYSGKISGATMFDELIHEYPELVIGPRWKEVS